jgi:hypothetical protein
MRRRRVAALLVLLALAGCGPERVDRWTPPAASTPPSTLRPEGEASRPPLNPAEHWIEAALARIGLVARVAEGSPRDRASMYVDLGADRPLAIVTVPARAAPSDWRVVAVRQLAGIELRTVRNDGGLESEWIVCGPQLVEVVGTAPDGYPTMDAFIERLVPALDCRS